MRIDKLFSGLGILSRSECKKAVKAGHIYIGERPCKSSDTQIDPDKDLIYYKGELLNTCTTVYYMLNKPAGVITANNDSRSATVFSYIKDSRTDLFAVGRLDKDTTGILLITNDGQLGHKLLSSKYHVPKTYEAVIDGILSDEDIEVLEKGVDIGDDTPTLPAKVRVLDESLVALTITEGRYHQVKRMFEAVGKPVIKLHRAAFGPLPLDPSLEPGEVRSLTTEEVDALYNCCQSKNQ